jgi:hypothetical protein
MRFEIMKTIIEDQDLCENYGNTPLWPNFTKVHEEEDGNDDNNDDDWSVGLKSMKLMR